MEPAVCPPGHRIQISTPACPAPARAGGCSVWHHVRSGGEGPDGQISSARDLDTIVTCSLFYFTPFFLFINHKVIVKQAYNFTSHLPG